MFSDLIFLLFSLHLNVGLLEIHKTQLQFQNPLHQCLSSHTTNHTIEIQ